jgi:hypothetical protein
VVGLAVRAVLVVLVDREDQAVVLQDHLQQALAYQDKVILEARDQEL